MSKRQITTNLLKPLIFRVQGSSGSSILIAIQSFSTVLVIRSCMYLPICNRFYARKQLLLSAHLSHCNSVSLSVTRVDQSKTSHTTRSCRWKFRKKEMTEIITFRQHQLHKTTLLSFQLFRKSFVNSNCTRTSTKVNRPTKEHAAL